MIYQSSFLKNRIYFHLTIRFSEKNLSHGELSQLWRELPRSINNLKHIDIHSCVLMSNHLHALASASEDYFDFAQDSIFIEFRNRLPRESYRTSSEPWIHIEKITSFAQYRETYRYIYRNPVEAGLVPMAEMYCFSSLHELLGVGQKRIFACDNMGLITNPFPILSWINWGADSSIRHRPSYFS